MIHSFGLQPSTVAWSLRACYSVYWCNVECSNVPIFKCSNVQILKCSNSQMFRSSNVRVFEYSNFQMLKCLNYQMFKCLNVQMFKCLNIQMFKCSNAQMFKSSNIKYQIPNFNKVKLLSECTSEVLPVIFDIVLQSRLCLSRMRRNRCIRFNCCICPFVKWYKW